MAETSIPFDCEKLRPPEYVTVPDPRTQYFVMVDKISGAKTPRSIYHQHSVISDYVLNESVPENVAIKFETAKNIYLYAWFVYRFYNVAEHEALACLEMALRERLKELFPLPDEYWSRKKKYEPTLKPMLRFAIDQNLVAKEGFRVWRERGWAAAKQRFTMERIKEMDEKGLDSIEYNESEITVTPEDEKDWDYLGHLLRILPEIRNDYAHGSSNLYNTVQRRFETVSEFINQLYSEGNSQERGEA